MSRLLRTAYAAVVVTALAFTALGYQLRANYEGWVVAAPERAVAALPGVGPGWLDTLRRVVGAPVAVDTVLVEQAASYNHGGALSGLYEGWYDRVRVHTSMAQYFRLLSFACAPSGGRPFYGYQHPPQIANPAAVTAHEFGHYFQDHVADSTVQEWKGWNAEIFADRFALVMLSIRGWLPADSSDALLRHVLSYRLRRSYWR